MHRTALLFAAIVFVLVGAASFFASSTAVDYLESETETTIHTALKAAGQDWAMVRTSGLEVRLTGVAPTESERLRTLEILGKLLDPTRIENNTSVVKATDLQAPRFSLEVLRNDQRVSLIGLVPSDTGRRPILRRLSEMKIAPDVTDMLETADYPVPDGWDDALSFALQSLGKMPRSKISVTPDVIKITAVTDSIAEQTELVDTLNRAKPDGIILVLDISAPRQVISPFRFRMTINDGTVALTSCSADTKFTRDRILRGVATAGHTGPADCQIGLGVPTPDWADAIVLATAALSGLGEGTVTFTDSDISLIAGDSVTQGTYDTIVARLENNLPDLFSLLAVLPPKPLVEGGESSVEAPEFTATKSPEGLIQLQGRLPDDLIKTSVGSFAGALFGHDVVFNQTRVTDDLPEGWPVRVLAALESLSHLRYGLAVVSRNQISVSGVSAEETVQDTITSLLTTKVGAKGDYRLNVRFDPALVPVTVTVSAENCETRIAAILDGEQIAFAPSSSDIQPSSQSVMTAIADVLRDCSDFEFVIEGHTDSQGGEDMNKNLSQARAESVLGALLSRRVLTSGIIAVGYGEEQPIADNETEDGRADNRRITFRLVTEDPPNE